MKIGAVIQVNEQVPEWTGCLMVVTEVCEWGIVAGLKIPFRGMTYLRLTGDQYAYIGESDFPEAMI